MEILNFNVKHHVAVDMLKPTGWLLTLRYNLECNLHIFHLFLNGVLQDSIFALLVGGISLFNHLRQIEPKFMGPFKVSKNVLSHYGDNSVSFL